MPNAPHGPHTFIEDAIYLKDHLGPSGATSLLMKYTGRMPSVTRSPSLNPRSSPSGFATLSGLRSRALSPRSPLPAASRLLQQQGGVEALFQGAAKNVLERSEKLGINQAVRDAMGEIRRNMQNLQDNNRQHLSRSSTRDSAFSSGLASPAVGDSAVKEMARRNKQLAGMLEETLSELRAITTEVLEDRAKSLEMIEMAVAKAQVVKICLEDSSVDIPGLPTPENTPAVKGGPSGTKGEEADVIMDATPEAQTQPPSPPATVTTDPIPKISTLSLAEQAPNSSSPSSETPSSLDPLSNIPIEVPSPKKPERPSSLLPARSSIAQSSFAWMLEPDTSIPAPLPSATVRPAGPASSSSSLSTTTSTFVNNGSSSVRMHRKRPSGNNSSSRERNAFLFGEVVPSADVGAGGAAEVEVRGVTADEIFGLEPIRKGR